MTCPNCGHTPPDDSPFCNGCGAKLEISCASCGATPPPGSLFCNGCGATLGAAPSQSQDAVVPKSPRAPRDYTPKHLSDKILQSKSALEGERKQVTVMFADVKGSMDLAEHLGPEDWHKVLDRFFEILTEGVHRFEGTVNQYTGDGIMALFGAPIAHEDHAQRACHSALHLRDALRAFSEKIRSTHGADFSTRIGLNSGEVIVGKIGDDLRMDYTAQGHTVGLAQRMEALAKPDTPYLTQATAKLVRGYFELEDQGEFNVKGASQSMRVYALIDTGAARTRVDSAAAKDLSKFVGREDELATLIHAFEESDAGRGQVIGLVAGPGLGKSRLTKEFCDYVQSKGGRVALSNSPAHGQNLPLMTYIEGTRSDLGIGPHDNPETIRTKLRARFHQENSGPNEFYALLCDLLGAADPEYPLPPLSPQEHQRRLMEWERRSYAARCKHVCLVVVAEDVHWLDPVSAPLLDDIIRWTPDHRQMVLVTQRPEYTPPWTSRSFYRQIPLLPLGDGAIDELTSSLLGPKVASSGLVDRIRDRCAGTPFFIEESIQSLCESGFLEGERENYTLVKTVDEIPLPATVQAVLAARIDRLGEQEKQILQRASIIGRVFPRQILKAISNESDSEIGIALETLLDAELLYEHAIHPDVEYIFKHALTQDVAYASQLNEHRESVHALVADALESRYPNQLDEKSALLAHHWEEAGEALLALRWHGRAAVWVGRLDLVAATKHWSRVRALRADAPDDAETATLGIAACRHLLQNMCFRVDVDRHEASALLEEGKALAEQIGDRRASLYISMIYGRVLCADRDVPAGLEVAIQNQHASLDFDDEVVQHNASHFLIDALWVAGRLAETLELANAEIARVPRHVPREEWLWGFEHYTLVRIWRSSTLTWTGSLEEGIEGLDNVVRLADEDGTPELAAYAFAYAGEAHYFAGDADNALSSAHQMEAIASDQPENLGMLSHSELVFGYAHLVAGQPLDAANSFRNALVLLHRVDRDYAGKGAAFLAIALLEADDLSAAESTAQEAIALCRPSLRDVYEAMAHGVIARVLLRRDGAKAREAVETEFAQAAALIERTGAKTLAPDLLEARAELASVLGDNETCANLLQEALLGYEAIGASGHAARLRKELET